MSEFFQEYINILISLEPVFKRAGELAVKMRKTASSKNKFNTGVAGIDIVTEADTAVQEFILSEMAKTKLVDCELIAEEDTPSVLKFKGTNGLVLALDPIDGTIFYANNKRFFCIIVCLHDGKSLLYSFYHYPVVNWSRRIAENKVEDFGDLPKVNTKIGLDLSRTIAHTFGEPEKTMPEIYLKLIKEGYEFHNTLTEITDESGSAALFFLNQVAGYYTGNPGSYDGLGILYYGQVKKYQIYSDIDISKAVDGAHGKYCPGWYVVLRK
ncbi:MAG: inositol monophosphatase family protein [Patescibacteria group bacterium]